MRALNKYALKFIFLLGYLNMPTLLKRVGMFNLIVFYRLLCIITIIRFTKLKCWCPYMIFFYTDPNDAIAFLEKTKEKVLI